MLPIAFIAPRGLYAVYIPTAGLAVFLAIVLVNATKFIRNEPARVSLFALAALTLAVIHTRKGQANVTVITAGATTLQDVTTQLTQLHDQIPNGSRILFVKDPFEGRVWDSTFLVRLVYSDNSLVIEQQEPGKDSHVYDYVWSFEEGKLVGNVD